MRGAENFKSFKAEEVKMHATTRKTMARRARRKYAM